MSASAKHLPVPLLLAALLAACGSEAPPPKPVTPAGSSSAPAPTTVAPAAPADPGKAPAKTAAATEREAREAPTMAPTPGTVLRETELKDKPYLDAKTLRKLAPETSLVIVDRQSGWLRVSVSGQQGWVRLLHVASGPPGSAGSREELESFAKLATGRAGTGNVVATTGIRGLDEEQLKTAKASPEELKKLESYGVTKEQAAEYARRHELAARRIAFLPEPKRDRR